MTDSTKRLLELTRRERLPRGMLWIGSEPEPIQHTVTLLAQTLFCLQPNHGIACGTCTSCQKVEKGHHPDLRQIAAEGKEIKIEQVRNFSRWLFIAPHEATRKIGIVAGADQLNRSSANALLKTLEEPPMHAVVILVVRAEGNLLPTVRSRLMPFRFPMPLDDSSLISHRPAWGDELEQLLSGQRTPSPNLIFDLTETIAKDKENLRWFLWAAQRSLRDQLHQAHKTEALHKTARLERLYDLSIATERNILHRYGNTALGLDAFLTEWFL